jgi:transcription termination factor Rho
MDIEILNSKKLAELREIAKSFQIENYEKMKKADLIKAISEPAKTEAPAKTRGRKKAAPAAVENTAAAEPAAPGGWTR